MFLSRSYHNVACNAGKHIRLVYAMMLACFMLGDCRLGQGYFLLNPGNSRTVFSALADLCELIMCAHAESK